ncbi:hypothetical protein V5O48_007968 [Marasmius crinis-equi]|uniref:F-box domain-containing protein n=1 Tax=Marasmius crinis-equi TaxID=585013 RepID=A0ABR3FFD9_9AGAR
MHHVVQQADAVHQQINAITLLLEQFNTRRSGLLQEASKRDEDSEYSALKGAPAPTSSSSSFVRPPSSRCILPAEVLELISNCLDKEDLVHVSCSNKSLHVVANRILYRTISITTDLSLNASFPFDQDLIRFLESQPHITDLSLRGFNSDPSQFSFSASTFNLNPTLHPSSLSPSALPKLTRVNAIHAGPDIMETVVKGRPVKAIVMPLYADSATKCLDALRGTSTPIDQLNIMSFDPNAPNYILEEISKRFPSLEALSVVLLLAECTERALEAAAPSLARFERLKYITFMLASPMEPVSPENEHRIAESWHSYCPSLKTIILPVGNVLYFENSTWSVLKELDS